MTDHDPAAEHDGLGVAIIGMAGRFPGANTIEAFWDNLTHGRESISFFTAEEIAQAGEDEALRSDPKYVRARGILADVEYFDAHFFDYTPREAQLIDPQQRIFLECAAEALERSGYGARRYRGAVGVYAGVGMSAYLINNLLGQRALIEAVGGLQLMLGNDKDFMATRVSYKLGLEGPSMVVQTACSTSLVAVHLAAQALLSGECDLALAGAVTIAVPQQRGYLYQEDSILSPDGHCRAFDARAQGTVASNGAGVVLLKRLDEALADGDPIYAVIRGSAVNNDGSLKIGYTAPRVAGQAAVLRAAYAVADIDPGSVSYIEAHGSGTALGDPIELAALSEVFREHLPTPHSCAIGSLKTNVGHLDTAAGVAGLIKTALALKHQLIPPSLHYERPNPNVDAAGSPFYVAAKPIAWPAHTTPRRAGVSSFGIGGTNVHVVVEEAPQPAPSGPSRPWQLLLLSAKTETALDRAAHNLAQHLRQHPELALADVSYTLQLGREPFAYRRALVCRTTDEAVRALEGGQPEQIATHYQELSDRPVVFMFSGLSTQYVAMGRELYDSEPVFRAQLDRCAELLAHHLDRDLREVLYPADRAPTSHGQNGRSGLDLRKLLRRDGAQPDAAAELLQRPTYGHAALFAVEYALAQLLLSWGIRPEALIGYSIGEYVAATLAGVFSLDDVLMLVIARARLIEALPEGVMLAVPLGEERVAAYLDQSLALAIQSGPAQSIVAGDDAAVAALEQRLRAEGLSCWRLDSTHAVHSPMMEPAAAPFAALLEAIELRAPAIPFLSNVTGGWITADEATDPRYWVAHLRQTVRFADGLRELAQQPDRVLLEVGPGNSLCALARQVLPDSRAVIATMRHPQDAHSDSAYLLGALGKLWQAGGPTDWRQLYAHEQRRRVELPTYPFERQRHWVEPAATAPGVLPPVGEMRLPPATELPSTVGGGGRLAYTPPRPDNPIEQIIAEMWQELMGISQIGIYDDFFELGGHSLTATQLVSRIQQAFPITLSLQDIFEAATIAALAQRVEAQMIAKLAELSEEEAELLA